MYCEGMPPTTNRGAETTQGSGLRVLVDWFQATLFDVKSLRDLEQIFGFNLDDFKSIGKGKYGYPYSLRYGHIVIYYHQDLNNSQGCHIEMSGQGCREYETYYNMDWVKLFKNLVVAKANITRLDIAADDFKPYFKIGYLKRLIKEGRLSSRFRQGRFMETIRFTDGEEEGNTIYYGSGTSRIQIRMYEKNWEQADKGNNLPEDIKAWNRTEIQARDERATAIVTILANGLPLGFVFAGVLKNYISFKDFPNGVTSKDIKKKIKEGKQINKSRWKNSKWWDEYIGDCAKLQLSNIIPMQSVERKYKWMAKSVSKSMAILVQAFEGDTEFIIDYLKMGQAKIKSEDIDIIDKFKSKNKDYEKLKKEILG